MSDCCTNINIDGQLPNYCPVDFSEQSYITLLSSIYLDGMHHNKYQNTQQTQQCTLGTKCTQFWANPVHGLNLSHPPKCKYGVLCKMQHDEVHCDDFMHSKQVCKFGSLCTEVDLVHKKEFIH